MSYDCVCDYYESPTVYSLTKPVARQVHKCTECGRAINPGDQYEKVFGVWDGDAGTHKTCARCVAMREWRENDKRRFSSEGEVIRIVRDAEGELKSAEVLP